MTIFYSPSPNGVNVFLYDDWYALESRVRDHRRANHLFTRGRRPRVHPRRPRVHLRGDHRLLAQEARLPLPTMIIGGGRRGCSLEQVDFVSPVSAPFFAIFQAGQAAEMPPHFVFNFFSFKIEYNFFSSSPRRLPNIEMGQF